MKLRDLFVHIGFNWDGAGLNTATMEVNKFKNVINDISFTAFVAKITAVRYAINALTWAFSGLVNIYTTFLEAAGQQERTIIAFEVLTGNIVIAEKTLASLHALAIKTPFTVPEIEQNALMLNAMGFETEKLTETMKMLGDIVAGLPNTSLERLAVNLGQVKAATYLTGKELRDFWRSGIPMAAELTKLEKFKGKTPGQIIKLIEKRQVGFEDVLQVFKNLTAEGGRFHNMSLRLMETIPGMWSNFIDQIILFKREIGTGLQDAVKPVLQAVIGFFEENRTSIKEYIVVPLRIVFRVLREIIWNIYTFVNSLRKAIEYFVKIRTLVKAIFLGFVAFKTLKGLAVVYTMFVKFHALLSAMAVTIPGLIKVIVVGLWAKIIPALKTLVVTTLPMALWGAAIVGLILFIEDIFRFFSEGEEKVESVIGAFKKSGPSAKLLVDMLESVGKIVAGLVYLVMNFDPGLLVEGINQLLSSITSFFNLTNIDIDKIITYWGEVGTKIGKALSDPILNTLDLIAERWQNTFVGDIVGFVAHNVRSTRDAVKQGTSELDKHVEEATKPSPVLFTPEGIKPYTPQQPVTKQNVFNFEINGADLTTAEKLKRVIQKEVEKTFKHIDNTIPLRLQGD